VDPKNRKILVTDLPGLTPRQVVSIYQKRWAIELVNWELKSGLDQHQVSGDQKRSENYAGIAVLAYLFLLRACHHEITPAQSWSIFQFQHALQLAAMTDKVAHNVKVKMAKARKVA
jgi:IS4 transposase